MSKNRNKQRIYKFIYAVIILCFEALLFRMVWLSHYNPSLHRPFWNRGNWFLLGIYMIVLIFFLVTYGGLDIGVLKRSVIIYSHAFALVIAGMAAYLLMSWTDQRLIRPGMLMLMTVADIAVMALWTWLFSAIYARRFPARRTLIVNGLRDISGLVRKMDARCDKFDICGQINISEGMEHVLGRLHDYECILIGDVGAQDRLELIKYCYEYSIEAYSLPKLGDILVRSGREMNMFDTQLYYYANDDLQPDQALIKRATDIVLSLAFMVLSSWIFILAAVAIKLHDGGPVFYTQKRLTKGGAVFDILKFRTMVPDAESKCGAVLASEDDPRITPAGRVLRATRMDELPQLINVLKGEMSLVGPRPERPELAAELEKDMPEFAYRLKFKAGLTGSAQVFGKYNTTAYDKLKMDLAYMTNYSFWLDIKIILMTPRVLFMKEATEGIEHESDKDRA